MGPEAVAPVEFGEAVSILWEVDKERRAEGGEPSPGTAQTQGFLLFPSQKARHHPHLLRVTLC